MPAPLSAAALDQLFVAARSLHGFTDEPLTDAILREVYDLAKWGPTAFNAQPLRFVFIRTAAGKARLEPALSSGNREKTRAAPVTAIIAYDMQFYEHTPRQFPRANVVDLFARNPTLAESTAFRNGTLQGAYFLLAARAVGLSVGPMSGFDADVVNREFFPDGRYRVNFLVNLGYAKEDAPWPRGPRLDFAEVAEFA